MRMVKNLPLRFIKAVAEWEKRLSKGCAWLKLPCLFASSLCNCNCNHYQTKPWEVKCCHCHCGRIAHDSSQMEANEARILLGFPPNSRPTPSQVLLRVFYIYLILFIQLRLPESKFSTLHQLNSSFLIMS